MILMNTICDFKIIQRNKDGFGRAVFCGEYDFKDGSNIAVCVFREEDNAVIVPWELCKIDGNKWSAELEIPQGGLYRVEARAFSTEYNRCTMLEWATLIACAEHVGVGDVFLLTGQSNMAGYGRDAAYDPAVLGVHLLGNDSRWRIASHPVCSPINSKYEQLDKGSGTSPSLSFGRAMMRSLGVPIGLVAAALGGVHLAPYDPDEENHFMYDQLINQLKHVGDVAGIVWYQGCTDASWGEATASTYLERFKHMIGKLREVVGNVPVVQAQLNRHVMPENIDEKDRMWGMVRDAQRMATYQLEHCYCVPTLDLHMTDGIHNASGANVIIGERLASALLSGYYGKHGSQAPIVEYAKKISETTVNVYFKGLPSGIRTMDGVPLGIDIEDCNGIMQCEKVTAGDGFITLTAPRKIEGNAKLHAYWRQILPAFFVRDVRGMPMLSCYNVEIAED